MKKKRLLCLLAVSLVLGLIGCGKNQDSATGSPAGEGKEPECTHEWSEATYTEPETCAKCGETRGERKPNYFEEHGVEVAQELEDATLSAVIYNSDDPTVQMPIDSHWMVVDRRSEPDETAGYQTVSLTVRSSTPNLYYDDSRSYHSTHLQVKIYDLYTGRMLPLRDTMDNDAYVYRTTVEVDGASYELSYSVEAEWEFEPWVYDKDGTGSSLATCCLAYTFKVPDGYDGLVCALIPLTEYLPGEQDYENVDESEIYALDEQEYAEGTVYFRIQEPATAGEEEKEVSEFLSGTEASAPEGGFEVETSDGGIPKGDYYEQLSYVGNYVVPTAWSYEGPDDIYSGPSEFTVEVEYVTEWSDARIGVFAFSGYGDNGMPSYTALDLLDPNTAESTRFFTEGKKDGTHTFQFTYTPTKVEGYPCILCVMLQPIGEESDALWNDPDFDPPRTSFELQ